MGDKPRGSGIGLADFIGQVKDEIKRARDNAKGDYMFEYADVELEMSFVVSKKAKGGIRFVVVNAGGGYSKEEVHTLRVKLIPFIKTKAEPAGGKQTESSAAGEVVNLKGIFANPALTSQAYFTRAGRRPVVTGPNK